MKRKIRERAGELLSLINAAMLSTRSRGIRAFPIPEAVLRAIITILTCLVLAGCWQSTGSLFGDVKPLQPFHAGKVVSSDPEKPGEVSHAVLTSAKDGSYRLTSTDKDDAGDAVVLRFIALGGLPKDVFISKRCRMTNADQAEPAIP